MCMFLGVMTSSLLERCYSIHSMRHSMVSGSPTAFSRTQHPRTIWFKKSWLPEEEIVKSDFKICVANYYMNSRKGEPTPWQGQAIQCGSPLLSLAAQPTTSLTDPHSIFKLNLLDFSISYEEMHILLYDGYLWLSLLGNDKCVDR